MLTDFRRGGTLVSASGVGVDRSRVALRWRTWIESTTDGINHGVRELLVRARAARCLPRSFRAEIEIAAREALANAVIHGNRRDASKRVFLRVYGDPQRGIAMLVRDAGSGFDPESVPDPRSEDRLHLTHGRGLLLMSALMDDVVFRREGREVLLHKRFRRRRQ